MSNTPLRLQQRFRNTIYQHHYSIRTEQTYWHWIKRFCIFITSSTQQSSELLILNDF
ncbi:phage integrase N-terminal SAM-like domain-containing protein [Agarivorans sp. QJM3NY_29]|uniref:phage integrase N-terminal SAM-like domain-containing protein n=1 Tax=unclassified Agarivorans TaxID=2636026 RepID=UPI003D7CABD6